jgi:uncharacterized protein (DUF1800 family)
MSAIRYGYGVRPGQSPADGPDALLAQLDAVVRETPRFPAEGIAARYKAVADFYQRQDDARSDDKKVTQQRLRPLRKEIFELFGRDQHARVVQSAVSPHGFGERLAAFWFDHFSVSARKQRYMNLYVPLYEAEAIRPHMAGPFATLLKAVIRHPAMLIYLDQTKSNGPNSKRAKRSQKGLNENLGRELLELHTLGVDGGYTQDDVRNAALVLTGLTIDRTTGEMDYRVNMAEPGPITFMGATYGDGKRSVDDVDAMLDRLAAMPQTGRHICRKLAIHFISDTPPQPLVEAMVAAWKSSGGNLRDVSAAMLAHPAAWENPGEKARQPYDFIVAGLRALDVPETALAMPTRPDREDAEMENAPAPPAGAVRADRKMRGDPKMAAAMEDDEAKRERMEEEADRKRKGPPLRPPLNPLTTRTLRKLGQPVWEPASPAGVEEGFSAWVSSSQLTGRIEWAQRIAARHAGRLDPDALLKAVLREAARDDTMTVVRQAPSRVAGTALVLASPEFNRR